MFPLSHLILSRKGATAQPVPVRFASYNWTGAIKITSTNGQLITSVLTNYWRWYVAAYNGVSGGAQPVFAPSIERR